MQAQSQLGPKRVLVTGANGNIGRRLLPLLAESAQVRAFVRSTRAQDQLPAGTESVVGDYGDRAAMTAALADCDAVVHLVGIIKESRANSFHDAHVTTSQVLIDAAAEQGITRVVYLSILGASTNSANPCLRSKAQAEQILAGGPAAAHLLQVPMVLGEGDYASAALKANAQRGLNFAFRADSLEQPIYVGDVVAAIAACLHSDADSRTLQLAGPESLTRRALIQRAAALLGNTTRIVSLPIGLGSLLAGVLERLSATPPVTRAMLGVLDHDDAVDPAPAAGALGIDLTPLDTALARCFEVAAAD